MLTAYPFEVIMESFTRENQIQEIATMIRDSGNTTMINVYAIQDSNGSIISHKNNMFYTTRKQARDVRRNMPRKDVKVVRTSFVNLAPWKTAK